jgi:hypothetical protein
MDCIEPYRQIVELQSEIVRISRRNSDLKKKCGELEEKLVQSRASGKPDPMLQVNPEETVIRPPRTGTVAVLLSAGLKTMKSVRSLFSFSL